MAIIQPVKDGKIVGDSCTSSERTISNEMGEDQFLQLLIAEMQNQDPLEPASNTEWVAQMATFSMVESLNSMQSAMLEQSANSLVGQYVLLNVPDSNGDSTYIRGKVDYVTKVNGETKLAVGDELYGLDTLDSVVDAEYYEGSVAANTFKEIVKTLPLEDNLSLSDESLLKSARKIYDELTEAQKQFVETSDLTKLVALEQKMDSLKATRFVSMVKELPSEQDISVADEDTLAKYGTQVVEAAEYYQQLTDAQKEKVDQSYLDTMDRLEKAMGDRQEALGVPGSDSTEDSSEGESGETGGNDIASLLAQILEEVRKQQS